MASNFDRWERDPFFPAAEEVQESADRMVSTYRTLIHASKEPSVWNSDALRRDLRTALGTTKWQLEEFERAVISSYDKNSTDDTKDRHHDFINAMENQISRVESSWNDSSVSAGKPPRPWVRLDERERKELALFLSGSKSPGDDRPAQNRFNDEHRERRKQKVDAKDKFSGHRRTASASADIGSWKINVDNDNLLSDGKIEKPPRKIPSFSGLLNTLESASKFKWPNNGYKKLTQEADDRSLETGPLTRGVDASNDESKSRQEWSDCYDKRLYGWYGAIQRQVQRSQYYILYSRRTRTMFWFLIFICLLGLMVVRMI
ncbi:putative syntaxin 6 [Helianthus anomalus]